MMRRFIFRNTATNTEKILPVTPSSYNINNGIRIETVNITDFGDIHIAGNRIGASYSVECMFPAQNYPFNQPGTNINPFTYVEFFQKAIANRHICSFAISDTPVRTDVLIESIDYGEKDGTNDIYATISFRKYVKLTAPKVGGTSSSTARSTSTTPQVAGTYTVKKGDTLSVICRKIYGNSALYSKLAKYNGIKNPNIISIGQVLKTPPVSKL